MSCEKESKLKRFWTNHKGKICAVGGAAVGLAVIYLLKGSDEDSCVLIEVYDDEDETPVMPEVVVEEEELKPESMRSHDILAFLQMNWDCVDSDYYSELYDRCLPAHQRVLDHQNDQIGNSVFEDENWRDCVDLD